MTERTTSGLALIRSAQLLKYPYGLFGTKRHPLLASSGSTPPLCHTFLRVLTLKNEVLTSGGDVIENKTMPLKPPKCLHQVDVCADHLLSWRYITGPRGKFGDQPILRSQGGGGGTPPPPPGPRAGGRGVGLGES